MDVKNTEIDFTDGEEITEDTVTELSNNRGEDEDE